MFSRVTCVTSDIATNLSNVQWSLKIEKNTYNTDAYLCHSLREKREFPWKTHDKHTKSQYLEFQFMVCNKIILSSQFYRSAQKDRLQNENANLNHSHSIATPWSRGTIGQFKPKKTVLLSSCNKNTPWLVPSPLRTQDLADIPVFIGNKSKTEQRKNKCMPKKSCLVTSFSLTWL